MTEPARIELKSVNGHGSSAGGENTCLDLTDSNGQRFILHIPNLLEGMFLSRFEAAVMHAAQERGTRPETDVISAIVPENTNFVISEEGTLILRTLTRAGVKLDMGFDAAAMKSLRSLLDEADRLQASGVATRGQ